MKRYAIIMAGGNGERLFPLSTKEKPKQFLNLYGQDTMINETIKRVEKVVPMDNIFIILSKQQKDIALEYIDKRIKKSHILFEPKSLNTAVCIAYATTYIIKKYGEGVISVFSSDHYISNDQEFKNTIEVAIESASKEESLIILGINPDFPSTQFGYIDYEENKNTLKNVKHFIEKPNENDAKEYVKRGYLWNSGIFVWNSNAIMSAFKEFLPVIYEEMQAYKDKISNSCSEKELENLYNKLTPISIDVGIIEKANNVKVILATFEWIDIGNLNILLDLYEKKNINQYKLNNTIGIDSSNIKTLSENKNKMFATIGVENLIIVDTDKVCLIANKDELNKIRYLVEKINNEKK